MNTSHPPLTCRVVGPPEGVHAARTVVLFHGFGAPGDDLVGLADALDPTGSTRFAFPAAPMDLGPAYAGGRAWWWVDLASPRRDFAGTVPDGLSEARAAGIAALDARAARFGVEDLVLGGFSQGAMLACDIALHDARPLAGLVLLSGALIGEAAWRARVASRRGLRVFQAHGRTDTVLPFRSGEALRDLLREGGAEVEWVEFADGHGIPPAVVTGLRRFLRA